MRDQCGPIFCQAKQDLKTAGLIDTGGTELSQPGAPAATRAVEESLPSDIDQELENLQVSLVVSQCLENVELCICREKPVQK